MKKLNDVLSLDISASSTGWSAVKNNKLRYGVIETDSKFDTSKRLHYFRTELIMILEIIKPKEVLMEDTFVGPNPKVNKLLSKFGGVSEQLVYESLGKSPLVIDNKTVKAFFRVKKKDELFLVILDLLGWKIDEDISFNKYFNNYNDIIDSIAQLLYGCDILLKRKKIKMEREYGFRYKL